MTPMTDQDDGVSFKETTDALPAFELMLSGVGVKFPNQKKTFQVVVLPCGRVSSTLTTASVPGHPQHDHPFTDYEFCHHFDVQDARVPAPS